MLRYGTGFFLIIMFVFIFSFSFIGVNNELNAIQSIDQILEDHISKNDFDLKKNSYMYDSNGNVISEIFSSENRIYLPYDLIPQTFKEAFIATEDRQFFAHKGFDMNGITRAIFANAESGSIEQGGSTITQQLVKNTYLNNERTYNRKLTELLYSYQLEKLFSKEEILELYLNSIYFQNGVYGIEAASYYYFSRPAIDLTISEVAFLSAIPNNPTIYNPLENPENTHRRKEWILKKMQEMNFISEEDFEAYKAEPITLEVKQKVDLFPDYVTYIHHEFELLVGEEEGFHEKINKAKTKEQKDQYIIERKLRVEEHLANGVHIYTALDPSIQNKAIQAVESHLPIKDMQGALVSINHNNQTIVALTGGKDFKKFDFHRGYQAYRQPGSAIKPLLVFAPYLAETRVNINSSVNAAPFCKNGYCPKNYGGAVYGTTTIEWAFKHSYNTAAARMLNQIGVEKGFSYLDKFDFTNIVPSDYHLPSALGGLTYGVTPLEMTNAYTAFGNGGTYYPGRGIKKVVDGNGKLLFEWKQTGELIWDKETNTKMRSLLSKVVTEGTGKTAHFPSPYIGGKTGTTNSYHDLWFVGLNEEYTTGVWVGYDTPKNLQNVRTTNPHLLIWRDIMR